MSNISFEELTYLSADGETTVHAYVWAPKEPRAILQLSHGMCEYVERYDEWARRFAEAGIVFCGNDHLGHGRTAKARTDLGFSEIGPFYRAPLYICEDREYETKKGNDSWWRSTASDGGRRACGKGI